LFKIFAKKGFWDWLGVSKKKPKKRGKLKKLREKRGGGGF